MGYAEEAKEDKIIDDLVAGSWEQSLAEKILDNKEVLNSNKELGIITKSVGVG